MKDPHLPNCQLVGNHTCEALPAAAVYKRPELSKASSVAELKSSPGTTGRAQRVLLQGSVNGYCDNQTWRRVWTIVESVCPSSFVMQAFVIRAKACRDGSSRPWVEWSSGTDSKEEDRASIRWERVFPIRPMRAPESLALRPWTTGIGPQSLIRRYNKRGNRRFHSRQLP